MTNVLVDSLVADLGAALEPERVRADPLEVALYARDASVIEGRAAVVCFPTTTAEVQAAVRAVHERFRLFAEERVGA